MDRRSLVGHSLWGRKRVRHNIVAKHKPPIDYNTDRAFLCCLLSLLFRYSKVAVDESSVFLKPPNGSALLAGHLIFASFPGASSSVVCKGFFCVWKLAWEVLRAWPCSDVSSWDIYSQTLELFWDHRVLSPIILFLSLSGWVCSLLSLWTLPLRWCDLSQVEPGCHAPGSVLLDGPSVGTSFLRLASYELTCRIPDSNWRLQWNIPVLGNVFIKIKSLLLRLIVFFFFFAIVAFIT